MNTEARQYDTTNPRGSKTPLPRAHLRSGYIDPVAASGRKPRAAILGRKSTATEGKSKSVREQIAECRQVCELMGLEVTEERIYQELDGTKGSWWWADSGKPGPHRLVLGKLVQDIKDGLIDAVVVWRSDRLYRSVSMAAELLNLMVEHNVRLISSRYDHNIHTATGLASAQNEAVHNEEMLGKTSEDIIRDLQFKKNLGKITRSPACLGFRSAGIDSSAARVVPEEIEIVRRIFRLYVVGEDERGPLCRNAIARQLTDDGVKLPRLRRTDKGEHLDSFSGDRIERIIQHIAYRGCMRHAHEEYECDQFLVPATDGSGRMETVVPLSLWLAANEKMSRETKADKRSGKTQAEIITPHLLTGTVVCGGCGRNLYGVGNYARDGVQCAVAKLTCLNTKGPNACPRHYKRKSPREEVVEAWVVAELFPAIIAEIQITRASAGRDADVQRLASLREQISQAELSERRKLRRAADSVDDGAMDQSQYSQLATDLRSEREAIGREAEALERQLARSEQSMPDLSAEAVSRMSPTALRAAIQAAIEWIAICPEGVVARTRWGNYTAARYRRPIRDAGEHWSTYHVGAASVVDSLKALSFIPEPTRFIHGRRHTLGDVAENMSNETILPGWMESDDTEVERFSEFMPEVQFAQLAEIK